MGAAGTDAGGRRLLRPTAPDRRFRRLVGAAQVIEYLLQPLPQRSQVGPAVLPGGIDTAAGGQVGVLGGVDPLAELVPDIEVGQVQLDQQLVDLGAQRIEQPGGLLDDVPLGGSAVLRPARRRARWQLSWACRSPSRGSRPTVVPMVERCQGQTSRRAGSGTAGPSALRRSGARWCNGCHRAWAALGSVSPSASEGQECRQPRAAIAGSIETGAVVVGIDGSERCRLAVKWAADEARRRSAPLVVLYAQLHEPEAPPAWYKAGDSVGSSGQAVVDDAVGPGGHPPPVAGRPGRGGRVAGGDGAHQCQPRRPSSWWWGPGGWVGSRSSSSVRSATSASSTPTVRWWWSTGSPMIRCSNRPSPRIVVGVDGSPGSVRALRWALDEARIRSASVERGLRLALSRLLRPGDRPGRAVPDGRRGHGGEGRPVGC